MVVVSCSLVLSDGLLLAMYQGKDKFRLICATAPTDPLWNPYKTTGNISLCSTSATPMNRFIISFDGDRSRWSGYRLSCSKAQ